MKNVLFHYLKSFMIESEWANGNTPEQARAMFTTLCFIGNIDADTKECDEILGSLYWAASMNDIMKFDEFVSFMVALIV